MSRTRGWRLAQPPCPICGRGFDNPVSMQQHLRDKHGATLPDAVRQFEAVAPEAEGAFEDALVKVVNSSTHDEAVRIAARALLGERA